MTKKIGLLFSTSLTALLILSACNSDSSNENNNIADIMDKNYLMIAQNIVRGECETADVREYFSLYYTNVMTYEVSSGALCSDYNRIAGQNCFFTDINEGNRDCIIGFDDIK